ncbi:MAG: M48 family metallopeptidase, partial [Granulosicoccus sp.]
MAGGISKAESVETSGFVYGHVHVPYRVERKVIEQGKPRKVSIQVTPDSSVTVTAPEDAATSDIHDAVMKRAKWIYDRLQAFDAQQMHVQPRRYVSGEMQFYLGRRYVLKIVTSSDTEPLVKMERGKLQVSLPKQHRENTNQIRELLRQWYRKRAQHVFKSRLEQLLPQTSWVNEIPAFRVLPMEKQWGSCSTRGTLMLNPHLVKAPRDCIDYVILHELCHIKEHNHGERFYRLLTQQMPDWKKTK